VEIIPQPLPIRTLDDGKSSQSDFHLLILLIMNRPDMIKFFFGSVIFKNTEETVKNSIIHELV